MYRKDKTRSKLCCQLHTHCMQFTFPWIKGAEDCGPLMGIGSYAIQFVCIRFRRD